MGNLNFIIADAPTAIANQCIGELWIRYKIRGLMPKLAGAVGKTSVRDVFVSPSTAALGATATGANLLGNGGKLYKGYFNNLGCVITQGPVGFTVIIPAYYTGCLRFVVNCKALAVVAGASLNWPQPSTTGKVQLLSNYYGENGEPTQFLISPGLVVGTGANIDTQLVFDVLVQSATAGVNNSVSILGSVGCTSLVQTFVDIVPFNNYGTGAGSFNSLQDVITGVISAGNAI
jgi:hypothetical protein